jgi:hypothetical protein
MIRDNILVKMCVRRAYYTEIKIILGASVAIYGLLMFFAPEKYQYCALMLPITLFFCLFLQIKGRFGKIDIITFCPMWTEISKEKSIKINYLDIEKIVVHYIATRYDVGGWVLNMTGRENTIKIITKDGKKITKNIFIENKGDYLKLKSLGDFLKEKGVEVKMKGFSKNKIK